MLPSTCGSRSVVSSDTHPAHVLLSAKSVCSTDPELNVTRVVRNLEVECWTTDKGNRTNLAACSSDSQMTVVTVMSEYCICSPEAEAVLSARDYRVGTKDLIREISLNFLAVSASRAPHRHVVALQRMI
jgi:hypothetical protein